MEIYRDPALYDALYTNSAAEQFDRLTTTITAIAGDAKLGGHWLEPACGTGRFLVEAVKRGASVVGFDLSADMVDFARQRLGGNDSVTLFVGDMVRFSDRVRDPIDVAFNLENTFRHLLDEGPALAHLDETARVLAPDGVAVIGLHLADYGQDVVDEDVWTGSYDGGTATQVLQYLPAPHHADRRETVISHVTISRPGQPDEHWDTSYPLRTYDRAQWDRLVRASRLHQLGWADFEGRATTEPPIGYGYAVLARPTNDER